MKFNIIKSDPKTEKISVIEKFNGNFEDAIKRMIEVYQSIFPGKYRPSFVYDKKSEFENIQKIVDSNNYVIWEKGKRHIGNNSHFIMVEAA